MNVVQIDAQGNRKVTNKKPKGKLLIIGGAEKGEDGWEVLRSVAQELHRKRQPLVLITAASYEPGNGPDEYIEIFKQLGISSTEVMSIPTREDAYQDANVEMVQNASAVFFMGGDQLRITSQMGDSPVFRVIMQRYVDGMLVAGTSAGAAAMPETMIIGGPGDESNRIFTLSMAPGLGFMEGVVIDSHFAERGRMGRLLGAVVQNPKNVGIGIDESTGILVEEGAYFTVIGSGAVYVVDGTAISYSSLSEKNADGVVTIHDVKLHVLGKEGCFDLLQRTPVAKRENGVGTTK